MKFFLIFCILVFSNIVAREITFLPSTIIGNEPESLKKKDKIENGFSDLTAYYTKENFFAEVSEFDKVKTFIDESSTELTRKPNKLFLSRLCEEFSSDFIARNEVNFDTKISVYTEVYNCRGKLVSSNESIIESNFYINLEKHVKKTFSFLTPKTKSEIKFDNQNKDEIIFCLDLSGGLTNDTREILDLINSITGKDGLSIGIVAISESNTKIIKPSFNHAELKSFIQNLKFSGEVGLDKIVQGLIKAKTELSISKIKSRKLILFTDAKSDKQSDSAYMSSIQSLKDVGFQVHIITGSYFDYKSMNLHKKTSKSFASRNLTTIIHSQVVGTAQGFKTLYLYDRNLYYDNGVKESFNDLNLKELPRIDEGRIYSVVDYPHPGNMADVFSKLVSKVSERTQIKSNSRTVAEKILLTKNSTVEWTGVKALISIGGTSFWVNMKSLNEDYIDKEISIRASFVKDNFTSSGITNIATETEIYSEDVPKLLVLEPKQIRNFLEKNSTFKCFIVGKVLEIK